MRRLCWSIWLVGICLGRVAHGTLEVSHHLAPPRDAQTPAWRKAELAGGLRLALARNVAESVRLCVGFAVPALVRDGTPQSNALVDLEMRIEALSTEQLRAARADSNWRGFSHVDGNTVTMCLNVPKAEYKNALSAALDVSRPLAPSGRDCHSALAQWQGQRGLAELVKADASAARLRALAWFGSSAPPPILALSLRRVTATACEHWRMLPAFAPSPTTLAVIGDFELESLESEMRTLQSVRQRPRVGRAQSTKPLSAPKVPAQSSPRFMRLRSLEVTNSTLMMGWPFIHQGERQSFGLRMLAAVIEQRLNRTLAPRERRAYARVTWASGYGTFEVEVRPTQAEELSSTEERVMAVIDQLRTSHMSSTEFEFALAQANSPPPLSGDLELDRARYMAQKALLSWDLRNMSQPAENYPKPAELQGWSGRVLSRTNVAAVFVEAIAPRHKEETRIVGQRPKGTSYTVKQGESLQMIARRFRVTIPELIRANHLRRPDQIAPGTRLVIPSAAPTPPSK